MAKIVTILPTESVPLLESPRGVESWHLLEPEEISPQEVTKSLSKISPQEITPASTHHQRGDNIDESETQCKDGYSLGCLSSRKEVLGCFTILVLGIIAALVYSFDKARAASAANSFCGELSRQGGTVFVVIGAIAKVATQVIVGGYAWKAGILSKDRISFVSALATDVLMPAFLFSFMSREVKPALLLELWIVPVAATAYFVLASGVGIVMMRLAGGSQNDEPSFSTGTVAAVLVHNNGSLPLALLGSLAASGVTPSLSSADGLARAVLYTSLMGNYFNVLMFTVGTGLLGYLNKGSDESQRRSSPPPSLLNPATQGLLLGLLVACVEPLKNLLYGNDAVLSVVAEGLADLGNASNPIMTLLLGANLAEAIFGGDSEQRPTTSKSKSHEFLSSIRGYMATSLGKLVVIPAAWLLLLWGVRQLQSRAVGWWPFAVETDMDPVLVLVLILQSAMPTAMSMSVLCTSWDIPSKPMLRHMTVMYAASLITVPAFVSIAIGASESFA